MDHQSKTDVKLFAGFLISSEVKMHLKASSSWKPLETPDLIEVRYEDRHYLGNYLAESPLTLHALREQQTFFAELLKSHCPKLDVDHCKFFVFSQLFIH